MERSGDLQINEAIFALSSYFIPFAPVYVPNGKRTGIMSLIMTKENNTLYHDDDDDDCQFGPGG